MVEWITYINNSYSNATATPLNVLHQSPAKPSLLLLALCFVSNAAVDNLQRWMEQYPSLYSPDHPKKWLGNFHSSPQQRGGGSTPNNVRVAAIADRSSSGMTERTARRTVFHNLDQIYTYYHIISIYKQTHIDPHFCCWPTTRRW